MRHFPAAKLQLHPDFVAPIEKFFAMPDFRKVIVLVDVNPKLDFLQFRTGRFLVLVMFRQIVTKLSERDDFANRRIGRGRNLDQIKSATLGLTQGV